MTIGVYSYLRVWIAKVANPSTELAAETEKRALARRLALHPREIAPLSSAPLCFNSSRRFPCVQYADIDHAGAREIIAWLDGAYRITDEIVQTQ